jgi:chemotaxis protein methyltransferase CheR
MISESLRQRLHKRLTEQVGLRLSGTGWQDFEARLQAAANDVKAVDTHTFIDEILTTPFAKSTTQALARHFTVGETYFFRDQAGCAALTNHLLPDLLRRKAADHRQLRIWSAGCCTGEEAYSIAILLDHLLPDQKEWNIVITATDINEDFLQIARKGIYNEWSFRGTPTWVREKYFKKNRNGAFELSPAIRQRVTFSYLNLADDNYPSSANDFNNIDFIFCRNVLMYFSPEHVRSIVDKFYATLRAGGFLSVSPAETSTAVFNRYLTVNYPGSIFYQRQPSASNKPVYPAPKKLPPTMVKVVRPQPASIKAKKAQAIHAANTASAIPSSAAPVNTGEALRAARVCANQGKLDEAIKWCAKAIAADKLNPACQYLLAMVEQERGMQQAAIQALQRTLYLDQYFVLAHFALASLRLAEGRSTAAHRHLTAVRQLLKDRPAEDELPESDGLTASELDNIAASLLLTIAAPVPPRRTDQ